MFKKGERIHLHGGRVHVVRKKGGETWPPGNEGAAIRGFMRIGLVDMLTGHEDYIGDWHENAITTFGHRQIVRNFAGLLTSASSVTATGTDQCGFGRYWALGSVSNTSSTQSSNYTTVTHMSAWGTEWGSASTDGANVGARQVPYQSLDATWTLSQTYQYASTNFHSTSVPLNAIAEMAVSSVTATATNVPASALSLATFAAITKSSNQALNVTYNWLFST